MERTLEVPAKLLPAINEKRRFKIFHGGRGSGKSWTVARMLALMGAQRPLRILCARETQKSIQESVHRLIKDQIQLLGLEHQYEIQEQRIRGVNGTEINFIGIRQQGIANIKSLEGTDICWVEEAQVVTKRSWDFLTPTIRAPGSEIWITFNPELDSDPTYERFVLDPPANSLVIECNWSDNPWFPPELEEERLDWQRRDPVGYLTVWEGKCRPAVEGAIYAQEVDLAMRENRLRNVPYDPLLRVHTVWDLGWNDAMSIAFVQRTGQGEVRFIDHIEDSHRTLDSYVAQIRERKWNWGRDFVPHDARAKDFKSGKSTEEILRAMGRDVFVLGADNIEEGIKQARMMFRRSWFDKEKATGLFTSLRRYRRQVNQVTLEPGAPLHDQHSHNADAFRYAAMAEPQMSNDTFSQQQLAYPAYTVA